MCNQLASAVEKAAEKAEHLDSRLTPDVLAIEGFTSPKIRHFLNGLGARCSCYLEVGSFHGATLTATCFKNQLGATAFEDFSQFGGGEKVLRRNIQRFCVNCNLVTENAFRPFRADDFARPVDLYFYDGTHNRHAHERALTHFEPLFAHELIFVCDDWNWYSVREGTQRGLKKIGYSVAFACEVFTKCNGDLSSYWNGLGIFVLQKHHGRCKGM